MPVRILLSTVSDEFRDYREQLRHDLTRHNVEVKVQEDFKDLGKGTLDKLDVYITHCDAVVHIVGHMTGAAANPASTRCLLAKYPDLPDRLTPLRQSLADGLPISYTQWEAWLAIYHNKLLLIAKADDTAPRGPRYDPSEDTRAMQQEHLTRLAAVEHYPGGTFTSPDNLAKLVLATAILDLLVTEQAQQLVAESQTLTVPGREQAVGAAIKNIATGAAAGDRQLQHALDLLKAGDIDDASKQLRTVADEAHARIQEDSKRAATAWRNLGAIASVRDPKSAREAYARAVILDPEDTKSLYWEGWFEFQAGDLTAAERSYRRLLTLKQSDPNSSEVYLAQLGLGDIDNARGRPDQALVGYRAAQASADRLAKSDPGNAGWQHDLSLSYTKIGDVLMAQDNLPEALKSYRDGLAIRDRLARSHPGNAHLQYHLGISNERIGNVLMAQGNPAEALKSYQARRNIISRLAESDPGNASWQRDLSVSYEKIGNVLVAQGNLPEALKYYSDEFAIQERLAQSDPGNADWQLTLSRTHLKLANVCRKAGDKAKALDTLRQGRAIMVRLTSLSPDNAIWKRVLAHFDQQIAVLDG
jgi:tetratricopeptide (TPR) repeat protein